MALLLVQAAPASATASSDFTSCLSDLQRRARGEGISESVVADALGGVTFRERVIELDRRQPESMETFADYLGRRVTDAKVERGRALADEHRQLLHRISQKFGVPPAYLLALWGIETNYGSYLGDLPVLDSLATLACDKRRGQSFSKQLMAALHILDRRLVPPERLTGSWAGAMGNFQFMPTIFLRYGVDFDRDGSRNLWDFPDALASAANFLRDLGWRKGMRWGREVRVPERFPFHLADGERARPLAAWRRLGVRSLDGRPLPKGNLSAALVLPAGHRGPAFLVYRNLGVIMRWNNSTFFALAVGHLADRIEGAGALYRPPPVDGPRLDRETVQALQKSLNERGYDSGEPDGVPGSATRKAIRRFQREQGMIADGHPAAEVLDALGIAFVTNRPQ